ncbi:hypothetical protein RB595_009021 [Gaeumannomyces hyphopodioides]
MSGIYTSDIMDPLLLDQFKQMSASDQQTPGSPGAKGTEGNKATGKKDNAELADTKAIPVRQPYHSKIDKRVAATILETPSKAPTNVLDLPLELFMEICLLLRPSDLSALSRVNRALRAFIAYHGDEIARTIICWRYPRLARSFPLPFRASLNTSERMRWTSGQEPDEEPPIHPRYRYEQPLRPAHIEQPPFEVVCECRSCVERWDKLMMAVDYSYWQDPEDHYSSFFPDKYAMNYMPTWGVELNTLHAAVVKKAVLGVGAGGTGGRLWHARILEKYLASTVRSALRHAPKKNLPKKNLRRRNPFKQIAPTEEEVRAETDAFLERCGMSEFMFFRMYCAFTEACKPDRALDRRGKMHDRMIIEETRVWRTVAHRGAQYWPLCSGTGPSLHH